MGQDLNLENLIYGNEMEKLKNKNSIQKETYFRNIDSIVINFDEIAFPYSIPFVFRPSFQLENINIILNIGFDYLYDEDNKQLAKDSEIYQEFKINFIATSNIETSFLIGEGGDISVSFTLQGILSNYMSETIISINFLANSYSILLKAKNSYNFIHSLCYMIKLNSKEHYVLDTKNERKTEELNQFYNKYPFIDPLIDNSLLKKLLLFSSKYLDLENIPQLINKNN